MEKKRYGFYSQKAAQQFGSNIYLTPEGKEVEITAFSDKPDGPEYQWEDKVPKGEITRWIRNGQRGEWPFEKTGSRL